jgi:hypothetical protein
MILKATKRKGVLQDVNGIDNSNLGADNVHKMMIFTKVKSLRKSSSEQGEKLQGLAVMGELDDKMANFFYTICSYSARRLWKYTKVLIQ